jgi:hypothetical protein
LGPRPLGLAVPQRHRYPLRLCLPFSTAILDIPPTFPLPMNGLQT